ncbi:uncharacterized protein LOC129250242 [Anastrepha obliqua]|uniref:uncharacterized protein LOC129250242 n=1 Tax=Anastrepha obliqua TaxID=95512 RepID=UPI002409501C|nr:uncharacterized protein LOC129250242 [Anastrepha obliqua]
MDADPNTSIPTFDGAGWFSGVKIIECKDDPSLTWAKEALKKLQDLWEGAALEIVDRSYVPPIPKVKVLIPRMINPKYALRPLQMQNKDVPTNDWKILKVVKSANADGSQNYILHFVRTIRRNGVGH